MASPTNVTADLVDNSSNKRPALRSGKPAYFTIALLIIVVLAASVRLYRLDAAPERFVVDEMVVGYEAWSLWSTGADQRGMVLPLHIRGYNEYSLALPIYMTAPFVGILGLTEFSARLPFALMGIVTVFLTGILGRRWFGPVAGAFAALFMAIDPWAVNFTRLAFLVGAVPLFTVLALLAVTKLSDALRDEPPDSRRTTLWAVLCGLVFALLTLSYAPMKVQGPLLLGICLLAMWPQLAQRRRIAVIWLAVYVLCISPLIYDQLAHWPFIQQHYDQISVTIMPDWFMWLWHNYAAQFDPSAVFFSGLGRTIGLQPAFGIGELFWLEGPLLLIAFAAFIRRDRHLLGFNPLLLFGLWLITYPLATSLTWGPTSYREINLLPLPELLAGYGLSLVLGWLMRSRFGFRAIVYGVIIPGIFVFLSFCVLSLAPIFAPSALTTSAPPSVVSYNVGLRPVLQYIAANAQSCDQIWLEPTFETYIAYVFYSRYPPARFQQDHVQEQTDRDGWLLIKQIENVHFGVPNSEPLASSDCAGKPSSEWYANREHPVSDPRWQQVFAVNNASGQPIWRIQVAHAP